MNYKAILDGENTEVNPTLQEADESSFIYSDLNTAKKEATKYLDRLIRSLKISKKYIKNMKK